MQDPFIGSIQYFAFDFAPRGYALCNGALLPVNQNQALFALLGTYYGGNGTTNFGIPDLQGRTMVGYFMGGSQPSNSNPYNIGAKAGAESVTLLPAALPVHTHTAAPTVGVNTGTGSAPAATGAYPAVPKGGNINMYSTTASTTDKLGAATVTVGTTGASTPVSVLSPYLALTCCIATVGLFPSRN